MWGGKTRKLNVVNFSHSHSVLCCVKGREYRNQIEIKRLHRSRSVSSLLLFASIFRVIVLFISFLSNSNQCRQSRFALLLSFSLGVSNCSC